MACTTPGLAASILANLAAVGAGATPGVPVPLETIWEAIVAPILTCMGSAGASIQTARVSFTVGGGLGGHASWTNAGGTFHITNSNVIITSGDSGPIDFVLSNPSSTGIDVTVSDEFNGYIDFWVISA